MTVVGELPPPRTTLEFLMHEIGRPYAPDMERLEAELERLHQLGRLCEMLESLETQSMPDMTTDRTNSA